MDEIRLSLFDMCNVNFEFVVVAHRVKVISCIQPLPVVFVFYVLNVFFESDKMVHVAVPFGKATASCSIVSAIESECGVRRWHKWMEISNEKNG